MDNQQAELEHAFDELAYVLGFLLGDGSLYRTAKGERVLAFACGDIECLEAVAMDLGMTFGLQPLGTPKMRTGCFELRYGAEAKDVWDFFFAVTEAKHSFPKYYFSAVETVQKDLLAGLWDSDGCVSKSRNGDRSQYRAEFVAKKYELVGQVKDLLRKLRIRVGEPTTMRKLSYADTFKVRPNMRDFAEARIPLRCRRKARRVEEFLEASQAMYAAPCAGEDMVEAMSESHG